MKKLLIAVVAALLIWNFVLPDSLKLSLRSALSPVTNSVTQPIQSAQETVIRVQDAASAVNGVTDFISGEEPAAVEVEEWGASRRRSLDTSAYDGSASALEPYIQQPAPELYNPSVETFEEYLARQTDPARAWGSQTPADGCPTPLIECGEKLRGE